MRRSRRWRPSDSRRCSRRANMRRCRALARDFRAADFFAVTKRIHNRLHGFAGDGGPLGDAERKVYERTLAASANELAELVHPRDIVILHDPQTAGLAAAACSSSSSVRTESGLTPRPRLGAGAGSVAAGERAGIRWLARWDLRVAAITARTSGPNVSRPALLGRSPAEARPIKRASYRDCPSVHIVDRPS